MNALFSLLKKRPNIVLLMVLLIGANIVAWLWAFTAFSNNTSLLALSLIAWCYGLRHAVDADHIAAIDSATRKLMQQKKRALTTGAWFSLGHSTIVVLASIGIALTTSVFKQHMAWFQNVGGLIGTTVSAVFLRFWLPLISLFSARSGRHSAILNAPVLTMAPRKILRFQAL